MDISKDIECNITINNCRENNLEMFFKKFLYMYMDNNIFKSITIVAKNVDENSRYILKQIEEEYSFIKVVENKQWKYIKEENLKVIYKLLSSLLL